jgi:transposase
MIQLTAQMRIQVAVEPVDFRRGIDGLCRLCRQALSADPLSGTVFVFRSRAGTAIKVLAYDGQGFWLCPKRLSEGRFQHWPRGAVVGDVARQLLAHELQVLLAGGNPEATQAAPLWRSITPTASDVAARPAECT